MSKENLNPQEHIKREFDDSAELHEKDMRNPELVNLQRAAMEAPKFYTEGDGIVKVGKFIFHVAPSIRHSWTQNEGGKQVKVSELEVNGLKYVRTYKNATIRGENGTYTRLVPSSPWISVETGREVSDEIVESEIQDN